MDPRETAKFGDNCLCGCLFDWASESLEPPAEMNVKPVQDSGAQLDNPLEPSEKSLFCLIKGVRLPVGELL